MATTEEFKNTVCMYFLVLHALCRVNRQNEGRSQCRGSKDNCRERTGGERAGWKQKETHLNTREETLLAIHFHPNNKQTNQKNYSPSVITSQGITW